MLSSTFSASIESSISCSIEHFSVLRTVEKYSCLDDEHGGEGDTSILLGMAPQATKGVIGEAPLSLPLFSHAAEPAKDTTFSSIREPQYTTGVLSEAPVQSETLSSLHGEAEPLLFL